MQRHFIPQADTHYHILTQGCECQPTIRTVRVHPETGEAIFPGVGPKNPHVKFETVLKHRAYDSRVFPAGYAILPALDRADEKHDE